MLVNLTIRNVALIDCVELNFTEKLNVLSGETGSGKSVIIDSLNFVLGAKADRAMIRYGTDECSVKAVFTISEESPLHELLKEYDVDDDCIVINRKYNTSGRGEIRINGTILSAAEMRKITGALVDLHGQSEHYSLVKDNAQLGLIDKMSDKIGLLKTEILPIFSDYKSTIKELEKLGGDDENRAVRLDILNYQISEIENANLRPNEEDDLLTARDKIKNQTKILDALQSAVASLSDDGGAEDTVRNAVVALNRIAEYDDKYFSLSDRLEAARVEIEDIAESLADILDDNDFSEEDADKIEERLDLIKKLKRKYGNSIEKIYEFLLNSKTELEKLQNYDQLASKYLKQKEKLEKTLFKKYLALSDLRRATAQNVAECVTAELNELGMKSARFEVSFNDLPSQEGVQFISADGFDKVEFLFSANKGEPLKPLSKIISGGELSRFMLAVKTVTAKVQEIGTFVFDEIDVGISGVTAKTVAAKFAKIAQTTQIIAISHLPQIAAMADTGLLIKKTEDISKTHTQVMELDANGKIGEVARLVGGSSESSNARLLAEELILDCDNYKNSLQENK